MRCFGIRVDEDPARFWQADVHALNYEPTLTPEFWVFG
jgi:hypothetical protein